MLGSAAALAIVAAVAEKGLPSVCVHVMPVVDHESVRGNARKALGAGSVPSLLDLDSPRDLEMERWRSAPETDDLRAWLDGIPAVDAFFSLHAADCPSGGAFFYVQGSELPGCGLLPSLKASLGRFGVPRMAVDPTPTPVSTVEPGFFTLAELGDGSFGHVVRRYRPRVAMVAGDPGRLGRRTRGVGRVVRPHPPRRPGRCRAGRSAARRAAGSTRGRGGVPRRWRALRRESCRQVTKVWRLWCVRTEHRVLTGN